MILTKDIELVEGLPVAYIRSLNAIAISDLHLGYEGLMAKGGVFIPKINLKKIVEKLTNALQKTKANKIIVVGDIKNEFSKVDEDEFNELYDIINFSKGKNVSLILIKGNHDNFVDRYKEPFKLTIYKQEAELGKYLFLHGERLPSKENKNVGMLIMGHEHPSIRIVNSLGKREKLRCFLYGEYKRTKLLVLPAMNYFASGTDINAEPKDELLSPIFEHVDVDKMHAIAVGYGSTLDFGKISDLRNIP